MQFVGRRGHLADLTARFGRVAAEGRGEMLAVRGRRQVGKSRLYTEFVESGGVPHVFFTAVKNGSVAVQMEAFQRDAGESAGSVPAGEVLFEDVPANWSTLLGQLRLVAASGPLVVVLDEFPWACETAPTLEGELQNAWDRYLQHLPILLILVGSDVAMMARLTEHDRPLYGRAGEEVIRPFNPAEVAEAIDTSNPMVAFDAYLTTGGYPKLVDDVRRSGSVRSYVARGLRDENTDLVVVAQRSLEAEFPADAQARRVLSAIGGHDVGQSTFSTVVGMLGNDAATSGVVLTRSLRVLSEQKQVLTIEHPAGAKSNTRQRRYRVADPYLRFWFRFIEPHIANITRGRGDVALAAFEAGWSSWRGLAIEPVVRDAVLRLAPSLPLLAAVTDVAPWWSRDNSVEVDVVASAGTRVVALGSVKWRERRRVTVSELQDLSAARSTVPHSGAARLVVVCPAGVDSSVDADVVLSAADLLEAWH
jgi:uncharacterized protein